MTEPWRSEITQWDKIGKESATTMLNLAEKRLSETVVTADIISKRADRLLSIQITLLTLALGYLFSQGLIEMERNYLVTIAFVSIFPLCISLFYIFKNFLPYDIRVPGEDPKNVAIPTLFDNNLEGEEKFFSLVLNQLASYQLRIDKNVESNANRMKNNTLALYALITLPIAPVVAGVLVAVAQTL